MEKLETGIPGFDAVAHGGLPTGRTTLVAGTAGSGKTIFGAQFLVTGALEKDGGVFVTFEESPQDVRDNLKSFGWDIAGWEEAGHWAFVDASPDVDEEYIESGAYDLGALLARIQNAIRKVGAKRLTIDSLGAMFSRFTDEAVVRRELFRLVHAFKEMGVTALMTAECPEDDGLTRFGVEEFIADNVIVLRNTLDAGTRRRNIEILKFRGTNHHKGQFPFTIVGHQGIAVIPLAAMKLGQSSSSTRVTSGNDELDAMSGGGLFRDSVTLVSGATGTGKTLTSSQFLAGATEKGERALLLAFEESREQLFRNAAGWGFDFEAMENEGLLRVECVYPESAGLEDHLVEISRIIDEFEPDRVAVDSLSALERMGNVKGFREFVIALTSLIKHRRITGLFTSTAASLVGGDTVTAGHISTLTDSIILLRYVEIYGEMRRGLTILKMRGSHHETEIREFNIDDQGMHIGAPFRRITGILAGNPAHVPQHELDRIEGMFD